jgi:pyrimidine deaminase RibD-like protein
MKEALLLAKSCVQVDTAYNVGALLVGLTGEVLASGFSREIEGNTHAEEVCLMKLMKKLEETEGTDKGNNTSSRLSLLKGATLYSTMEPCSKRLSGKKPCCELLAEAGIARVVIAVREPSTFVQKCEGADQLASAGIKVDFLDDEECQRQALAANAHLKL